MEWFMKVLKDYAIFSGRARRKEYWMFHLVNVVIGLVLVILSNISVLFAIITGLYYLAIFIPSLAVTVRRLHDTGKSGAWFLISFVPLVGGIILLIFTCTDSQPVDNQYGPNPKATF
ncbi:DUF805 domain-containing protein [Bacillus sp. sid0103]|uniref:DUF805 domain-containing protein n=1 Tax=Bacillus sp. sid0103 TaxID=2856337 RepID=UPI001C46DD04|nr:DUF805 domain-containing protein [Bacillus sp. sid0103]MBV7508948.1 DUF805 domain-containing protein [Bacillus sp. sid0103]